MVLRISSLNFLLKYDKVSGVGSSFQLITLTFYSWQSYRTNSNLIFYAGCNNCS